VPPPAYEATPSSNNNPISAENEDVGAAAAGVIEAPPPYCLVDPSKVRSTDHLPHYPNITPVEIIDLNTNNNTGNEQVKLNLFFYPKIIFSSITSHLVTIIKQLLLLGFHLAQIWMLVLIVHF